MAMHVLVVDDQAMIRKIHADMLTAAGHKVETANNGQEGLELFRAFREIDPFDLIMTDEEMPVMTGIDMCHQLYEHQHGLPIIMISSVEDMALMARLIKMGITFFRKPLRKEELYPYLEGIEERLRIQRERDERYHDHEIAEMFLTTATFRLELNTDISVHPSVIKYILDMCESYNIGEDTIFRVQFGLEEILINSLAHGNLEIPSSEFKRDGNFKLWNAEIERRSKLPQYCDRKVTVSFKIAPGSSVNLSIEDEGNGFDHQAILAKITPEDIYQCYGRGLVMLQNMADALIFNAKGNRVSMIFHQKQNAPS